MGADSVPKKLGSPLKILKIGYEGYGDEWDHWYLFDTVLDVSSCSKITLGGITAPENWAYLRIILKRDNTVIFDVTGTPYDGNVSNNKIIAACSASYDVTNASSFTIVVGNHYGNQKPWINNIIVE